MQQEKISIVVPIYNVEKYLKKCINSLLAQNYDNFEIILVDDGSTDGCPSICDEYENKYEKIKVIHKKNGGLSDARNTGVKNCTSDYVVFIDSDDYVEPNMLLLLWLAKKKYKADIVCAQLTFEYSNGISRPVQKFDSFVTDAATAQAYILRYKYSGVSACAKLFPIEILKEYPYPKNELIEDLQTTFWHIGAVNKIAFIPNSIYHYVQRNNSISYVNVKTEHIEKVIKVCEQFLNMSESVIVKNAVINRIFNIIGHYCYSHKKIFNKDRIKFQNILKKYIVIALKDNENSIALKLKFCLLSGNMVSFNIFRALQIIKKKINQQSIINKSKNFRN